MVYQVFVSLSCPALVSLPRVRAVVCRSSSLAPAAAGLKLFVQTRFEALDTYAVNASCTFVLLHRFETSSEALLSTDLFEEAFLIKE